MSDLDYRLNGVALSSANCVVTLGSTWLAAVSPVRSKLSVPGMHGTVHSPLPPVFDEREVTIKFGVGGPAYASETDRIAYLCTLPQLVLSRTVDGVTQSAVVELSSLAEDGDTVLGNVARFTAVFALPGVWWRGEARNVSLPLTGGQLLASGVCSAPLSNVVFRLPKGATSASITDPVSGTGVSFGGAPDADRYTFVDSMSLSAWRSDDGSMWDPTGDDVSASVDYPANGPLVVFQSSDGSYSLSASVTGAADSDAILAHFSPSWW